MTHPIRHLNDDERGVAKGHAQEFEFQLKRGLSAQC